MKKPIIGVVAPRTIDNERPFKNVTNFVDNFPKRIIETGGIPIGLLFPDGKFNEEIVRLCDGFLIQGGADVEATGINVINYAIKNNKPVLGICLGMQTMAGYEWIKSKLGDEFTYEDVDNYYNHNYEEEFLKSIDGHNIIDPFYYESINLSKHKVYLDKNSEIYKIFNNDVINMPSLHKQAVIDNIIGKEFKVTGRSEDGVIEALENTNPGLWIIGTQFHPELEKENLNLFRKLIDEALKRSI